MAAVEALDFNQLVEQSSTNGDTPNPSGGTMTWNFRCDPNLAWDPSQSYFAMEITIRTKTAGAAAADTGIYPDWQSTLIAYIPDYKDWYPFFPLRAFSSMSHIIDGVTVAHSNQPYADKIMQEKYLHDTSVSNYSNFESLLVGRAIDDGMAEHNLFMSGQQRAGNHMELTGSVMPKQHNVRIRNVYHNGGNGSWTVLFQPPFDMWTKHQRISGGNHMILLDLKPSESVAGGAGGTILNWGRYFLTPCQALSSWLMSESLYEGTTPGYNYIISRTDPVAPDPVADADAAKFKNYVRVDARHTLTGDADSLPSGTGADVPSDKYAYLPVSDIAYYSGCEASYMDTLKLRQHTANMQNKAVTINTIRLLRRMVRFTIERPIQMEEFNCTEMAFFTGTPSTKSQMQNFLLPSSTFGIAFYWRDSTNSYFDVMDDFSVLSTQPGFRTDGITVGDVAADRLKPTTTNATAIDADNNDLTQKVLNLKNFYFTYGGQTYPAQRITNLYDGTSISGPGAYKMHAMTSMLQGVMNTDQERYNTSFNGDGLLNRMDSSTFFFPVAKHNNSDNSDLQVYWEAGASAASDGVFTLQKHYGTPDPGVIEGLMASLVVVAFYDARTELAYNAANQLEKVTKTEWK